MPLVFSLKDCKGTIIHSGSCTLRGKLSVQFQGMEIYLLRLFLKCSTPRFPSSCPRLCMASPVPGSTGLYHALTRHHTGPCVCRKLADVGPIASFYIPLVSYNESFQLDSSCQWKEVSHCHSNSTILTRLFHRVLFSYQDLFTVT